MSQRRISEEEGQLLDALRAFVKSDPPAKSPEEGVTPSDVAYVLGGVVGLGLVLTLIPIGWKSSDSLKQLFEDVLPWVLNLTTIGAILKSPDAVLQIARQRWFQYAVAFGVPVLAVFALQVFPVDPKPITPAQVFVDGTEKENLREGRFKLNLWFHEIVLRTEWGNRRIAVSPWTLLHGDLSQQLRPLHQFKITIQDNDIRICVQPKGFAIDDDYLKEEDAQSFTRIGAQAAEKVTTDEGTVTLVLPA